MYKEEELKRLHAAGYGQVGFNYDAPTEPSPASQPTEVDEPFVPTPSFKALLPSDVVLPESQKQNAIIEKTAEFIANQGTQMEILIKAKQGDNSQFQFLNKDSILHPYYTTLISLVKAGKWPEKKVEHIIEEKPPENEEYLHPSLASTVIESAPSIPSIHYKPSADCDYTMLISKMKGEATLDEAYSPELAPGEVAPPGTEPLPPRATTEISRGPVMYNTSQNQVDNTSQTTQYQQYHQQYAAYYQHYMTTQAATAPTSVKKDPPIVPPSKSTGLSLMKNYNTDSDSEDDLDDSSSTDSKDKLLIITPPEDVKVVIDKMAAYVARNGDEFAEIVRAKNDPRFTFLELDNIYHGYYKKLMQEKRGDLNGTEEQTKKLSAPVSFSIKKLKEPDPILPKPALPYESSSEEESENTDKQTDIIEAAQEPVEVNSPALNIQSPTVIENVQVPKIKPITVEVQTPKTNIPEVVPTGDIPPVVVYKMERTVSNNLPAVKAIETTNIIQKQILNVVTPKIVDTPKPEDKLHITQSEKPSTKEIDIKKKSPTPDKRKDKRELNRNSPSHRREKKKHRDRKKVYKSKLETVSSRTAERRSLEWERKREKERDSEREKKRIKMTKDNVENEIISLEDNSNDMIDLTGDISDSKGEGEIEMDRGKQLERRRRAAEFLKKVGVDPGAAALPTTSLASAMVDTLESLRKKKVEEEEKRRRREKRRHRDRRDYEDESEKSHRKSKRKRYRSSDEDSDCDSLKRRKHKKDKRHSSKNKKKRKRDTEVEEDPPLNIDLTSTLKELRTSSPTKELGLQDIEENTQQSFTRQDSSSEDLEDETENKKNKKTKKKESREYSEGEWSSDSAEDSGSTRSTNKKDE